MERISFFLVNGQYSDLVYNTVCLVPWNNAQNSIKMTLEGPHSDECPSKATVPLTLDSWGYACTVCRP